MLNKLLISLFLARTLITPSLAIDENHYEEQYSKNIIPLIRLMGEGSFTGADNIKIHYRTYLQVGAKNCLVILPGRTEAAEKYAEVVFDLAHSTAGQNLNFYLMDHRGQGSSERMKSPSDMGHVDQFKNYVMDVNTFVKSQNLEKKCENNFLLAHSMGAGIATAYVLEHPNFFQKVALSSPMLKIMTKPYSYGVARAIVDVSILAGRGAKFAIGKKGFEPNEKFENNTFTTSPARFKMAMSMFDLLPVTKLGGPSNRWVLETMKGTNLVRSRYRDIHVPLRIYHAGIETYSEPSEMIKLCDEANDCQRKFFPTSKHEVLMERDAIRLAVINSLNEFFSN